MNEASSTATIDPINTAASLASPGSGAPLPPVTSQDLASHLEHLKAQAALAEKALERRLAEEKATQEAEQARVRAEKETLIKEKVHGLPTLFGVANLRAVLDLITSAVPQLRIGSSTTASPSTTPLQARKPTGGAAHKDYLSKHGTASSATLPKQKAKAKRYLKGIGFEGRPKELASLMGVLRSGIPYVVSDLARRFQVTRQTIYSKAKGVEKERRSLAQKRRAA